MHITDHIARDMAVRRVSCLSVCAVSLSRIWTKMHPDNNGFVLGVASFSSCNETLLLQVLCSRGGMECRDMRIISLVMKIIEQTPDNYGKYARIESRNGAECRLEGNLDNLCAH